MMASNLNPLVTVITVSRNAASDIERTLISVQEQDYPNIEHIVIDGESNDATMEIVASYSQTVSLAISEPDAGIYDAMNKGVLHASGIWLHFLNSGDTYAATDSLTSAIQLASESISIIYSDTIVVGPRKTYISKGSFAPLSIVHQSLIYRKSLHDKHGTYLSVPGITIADYMFFWTIFDNTNVKASKPISRFYSGGVSSSIKSFYQKVSFDFMMGRISRTKFVAVLALYPIYRSLKRIVA